ncbi:hypothetical protein AOC05_16480 [Arthrobacter alpinus]|uniref:Uncharacterized protein n=1 Tax=Arthrobacter alpinus TaxID=656366 RepID=A0A0M3UGQ9_9MICC|nr:MULTISPECIES: hypothetical protein [Arthrobacter]ALE93545.1 hypothetical protein AOC05_16480 [Arthrobacter alpinus]
MEVGEELVPAGAVCSSGAVAHGGFVAVDDGGEFSFFPSSEALLADFEYTAQAICIVGRDGSGFRLLLDTDRHLAMGTSLGPVDFSWLRQAWLKAQRHNPGEYPLRRFYPAGRETLLACMFETLYLEHAMEPVQWNFTVDGKQTHPVSLEDIDGSLTNRRVLERARVQDPFGHLYRPVRVPGHAVNGRSHHGKVTIFVEIPAMAAPPSNMP